MRCAAGLVTLLFAACSGPPPEIASRTDALGDLIVEGPPDSGLGSFVAVCGSAAVAAGPAVLSRDSVLLSPPPTVVSALSCHGQLLGSSIVVGGPSGLGSYAAGLWVPASGPSVLSLLRDGASGEVLVSRNGKVEQFLGLMPQVVDAGITTLALSGNRVAGLDGARVHVLNWRSQVGSITPLWSFAVPSVVLREKAVAIGSFLPGGGKQVAVSTTAGAVLLLDEGNGVERLRLQGSATFGTSLAVKAGHLTTLDALFVGIPGEARVVMIVGDAGVRSFEGVADYGAAIAWDDGQNRLLVGAPSFDGGGAVFSEPFGSVATPAGVVTECDVTLPCVPPANSVFGCVSGVCVGGVYCAVSVGSDCPMGMECAVSGGGQAHCVVSPDAGLGDAGSADGGANDGGANDAGMSDAGMSDAGTNDAGTSDAGTSDAGTNDAGMSDAGTNDAGPIHFATYGCASAPPLLIPLAMLWLLRRRRQA